MGELGFLLVAVVLIAVVVAVIRAESRALEMTEPAPHDFIDFEAELKARGGVPLDRDYEEVQ